MSTAWGRRMPAATAHPGQRHGQRQGQRARVPRHEPGGGHHQHVDERGPEQPAHPPAVLADGAAVARDHRGGRDDDTDQGQRERDAQQRQGDGLRQRQAGRVQVQRPVHRRQCLARPGVGDLRRHDEEQGRQQGGRGEAEHRRPAPPPGRQATVRVEQQEQRQPEQQPGPEPLHDPEGERRAGQRRIALQGIGEPGLRQPVQRPQQTGSADHPGDGVARGTQEQQRRGDGEQRTRRADDPAGRGLGRLPRRRRRERIEDPGGDRRADVDHDQQPGDDAQEGSPEPRRGPGGSRLRRDGRPPGHRGLYLHAQILTRGCPCRHEAGVPCPPGHRRGRD